MTLYPFPFILMYPLKYKKVCSKNNFRLRNRRLYILEEYHIMGHFLKLFHVRCDFSV